MEDEEEVSNNQKSPVQEVEDSTMEEKPVETVEVTNTEQCVSVAELDDSNLGGVEAPVMDTVGDFDEAVTEGGILIEGAVMEVEDELVDDSELPIVAEDEEVEVDPIVDTEVDAVAEIEIVDRSEGKCVAELGLIGVQEDSELEAKIETEKSVDEAEILVPALEEGGDEGVEKGESMAEAEEDEDEALEKGESMAEAEEGEDEALEKGESMLEAEEEEDEALEKGESMAEAETLIVALEEDGDEALEKGESMEETETLIAAPEEGGVEAVQETLIAAGDEDEMEMETVKSLDDEPIESQEEDEEPEEKSLDDEPIGEEDEEPEEEEEENAEAGSEMEQEMDMEKIGELNSVQELDEEPEEEENAEAGTESPIAAREYDEEDLVAEGEDTPADNEMEVENDAAEVQEEEAEKRSSSGGKRKRGKNSRSPAKTPMRKTIEEDVCFICFDGGDLVLCDRRGCPKAYHPSCINRDEAFFRAKGRWNCGWHICSNCEKNAHYMCYTCTFSLCKGCIKDGVIYCIRGNKGFCETCMKTVMLIESNQQGNKEAQVDFDDKSSWEYLFKDYWIDLQAKLSLSSDELAQAKNSWKGSDVLTGKQELSEEQNTANSDRGSGSDSSDNVVIGNKPKRRKVKKKLKTHSKEEIVPGPEVATNEEEMVSPRNTAWASKELLEFVMHMKDGDNSVLSQFDVQALLLEYIKINKLRDPRRKSQIICDSRLENLFGKPRVGHFEMLKLLESHFLVKEDSQTDDAQGTVVDTEASHLETDGTPEALGKGVKDKRRRSRKKDDRGPQLNVHDYAAIDIHNINFIYLRRKLLEDLVKDTERFHDKVVGTFVRIRITGSNQRQELYRLVQVIGTTKGTEPYKAGKKTTDIMLQILNLSKTEDVAIDAVSNQEFTEEECKRLRQSIKCGLLNRLTVGDILEKATEIQEVRVSDWLESETVRLSHLCDRASEKGRKKELRECVEKLQILKTSEERRRRLDEIPEVHADPKMDPSYESEEDDSETENRQQDFFQRSRGSGFNRQGGGRDVISPQNRSFSSNDRNNSSRNMELRKDESNTNYMNKGEETTAVAASEVFNENERSHGRGREINKQQSNNSEKSNSATISESEASVSQPAVLAETAAAKINETEKIWHYKDPSGKIQGPFSMVQLRKWNNNGYFPADLRIWKSMDTQENSYLLTDALVGKFLKESATVTLANNSSTTIPSSSSVWSPTPSVGVSKLVTNSWSPDSSSKRDFSNLPSPTPKQNTSGNTGPSAGSVFVANSFSGQNVDLATKSNGSKEQNAAEMLGAPMPMPGGHLIRGPGNALPAPVGTPGDGSGLGPKVEMVSPHTILGSQSQAFGAPLSQKVEHNSSTFVPGQPGYGQWGTVPAGTATSPGVPAMPPPDAWRPSIPTNQPNIQAPGPYNVLWSGTPGPRPDNQNTGWGGQMGWGAPAPAPTPAPTQVPANMNWGGPVQGPGWFPTPGNPGAPGNINPGWVAMPGNPGAPGSTNAGWGAPTGNVNQNWNGGNPGAQGPPAPGNANSGWGSAPTGNQGPAGSEQQNNGGDRYSGQHNNRGSGYGGGGRQWNGGGGGRHQGGGGGSGYRPPMRGSHKDMVCPYNTKGRCRKGTSCDYKHI